MSTFALNKIQAVKGQQTFYKLLKDNKSLFDEFEASLESQYKSELGTLYAYMERVANGEAMPATKFKDLTPSKQTVKEYEIKTKNLRVYLIKCKGGKIVVLGGYKNTQKNDLIRFRSLKKQYLQSISGQGNKT